MDLTLQKISLNYFSANVLCNIPEMNNLILNTAYLETNPEMSPLRNVNDITKIESKAKKLLLKLPEMGIFKHMILEMLYPITCRILRWKIKYARTIDNEFLNYFYWTNAGRIDNIRTASYIIENTMIPITKRFVLACIFCLGQEIYWIWTDMSIADRIVLMQYRRENHPLCYYWMCRQIGEPNEPRRNLDEAIDCAIRIGSLEAVRYLFQFYPRSQRSQTAFAKFYILSVIIKPSAGFHENFLNSARFFFCQMNENHRLNILRTDAFVILTLLLYPVGQSDFLNTLKTNIPRISEHDIRNLLAHIMGKISLDTYRDYGYFKLIVGMWTFISEEALINIKEDTFFLKNVFCKIVCKYFRIVLIKKKYKETKKTMFAKSFLLNQDKWKLTLFLIKKGIVTAESLNRNKMDALKHLHIRKSNKPAWGRLLKFVNDNGLQNRN